MNWRLPPSCRDEWGESYPLTLSARRADENARYDHVPAAAQYYELTPPCPVCGHRVAAVNARGERWCRECLTPNL